MVKTPPLQPPLFFLFGVPKRKKSGRVPHQQERRIVLVVHKFDSSNLSEKKEKWHPTGQKGGDSVFDSPRVH